MRLFFSIGHERHGGHTTAGALALGLVLMFLSGCNLSSSLQSSSRQGVALRGRVRGGQQPVSGASILLYAAGSSGTGAGAVNLLAPNIVTTDASGAFNITGDYMCPTAATQVYLVASGGNPGLAQGIDNSALVLMAALGNCGDLTQSTSVEINEVTTVASAWALAQFLGPGAMVGSSSTNTTGLANAFAVASNLADTGTGLAPGSALPTGAVTETAKLYTLADILAVCVNSDGGSACAPLFEAATTSQGAPQNTLDAALNIVQNPGNVTAVFNAGAPQGPFQPVLSAQPNDWTMSITYGGCTPACGGLNTPGAVAIDSGGNVFVANYFGGVVSEFSPAGVPVWATGIPGAGLDASYGIAVDGSDNVWVANYQSVTGANNHHFGSVSKFSSAGVELSGYGYTVGGVYYPLALAADSTGAIWIADYGDNSATLLAGDGSAISSSGYAASALPFTSAVALDGSRNAWFAAAEEAVQVTPAGAASSFTCCSYAEGIAIDLAGNVWIADYGAQAIVELPSSGSAQRVGLGDNAGPKGIAIDGAGNVWAGNYRGDSFVEVAGSTATLLSPVNGTGRDGYGHDAPLKDPYGLAIDASGNLWISNASSQSGNTLTQFVGLASPVKTPLLGPPVLP
jgi:streptogramin lyase